MDAIDTALVGLLEADATLTGLAPGGVFFDIAPTGASEPFLTVTQAASEDGYVVGRTDRRFDDRLYDVQAVAQAVSASTADAAAARVDALLNGASLNATGHATLNVQREGRIRYVEGDGDRRFQHSGGTYAVEMLKS